MAHTLTRSILAMACALGLLGCGETPTLSIRNTLKVPVLFAAAGVPVNGYQAEKPAASVWDGALGSAGTPSCGDCAATCAGEPVRVLPVYIEVPTGKLLSVPWDGAIYHFRQQGCACGKDCFEPGVLADGTYTFNIKYRTHTVPGDAQTYTREDLPDGTIRWTGSKPGSTDTEMAHTKAGIRFERGASVTLDFSDDCPAAERQFPSPSHDGACIGNRGCMALNTYELGCQCSFCIDERCVQARCVD